ncbi:response regulator [Gilvimarinus polysaccharolyticus]|uniref:response regulator n=1 Tax=Gilvimarinus polysaccharolyticus TaxID=863921 RepID=UPI0018DE5CA5|nr:response regulator [Gilvimarinus polysaccharolyticus]
MSATLSFFYVAKVNDFVAQHGLLLSEKTAHLVHIALNNNQPEVLESLIQATLDEPMVRAVHIYNASTEQHLHRGPRFNIDNTALLANTSDNQMIQTREGYRFRHPIITGSKQQNLGWLDIELTLSSYQVNIYQILFIIFATTASGLLLAGFLAKRLLRNIVEPLTNIQQVIDRLSKGHLDVRLKDNIAAEFKQLGDTVNTMADAQEHAQKNMQLHIDESMEELQETLETIEIQNVELDLARKEALAASHIKSEFLANTSHEIRTPLNGIIGFTNLALKTELNDDQKKYLQTIHNSAQNLTSIINDIFDFSKIESGKLELDYTSMSLRALAEASVATFAFETQEKNLQIVTIIDNNIPPQLMGDPQRFNQVLANLLSNAIKFSQRGTICIEFTLENFIENQVTIKASVKDEGIGLNQEQQAQLFSAFSQADSSNSRKHGGAGLGLAICKGLVDRMQGEIGVESQPNKGAQFWFTAILGVDPNYAASEQNTLKNKRILICCENPLYYRQIESLVGSWQAKTLWLNAIHDIFTHLRTEHLAGREQNLVIIDIAPDERKFPPVLLGNIAEQLALEFSCKVIVCCSNAHLDIFSQYDNSKSIEFVTKPIIQSNLLNAISHSLDVRLESEKLTQDEAARAQTKILLVDDNNANLQLTTELLRDLNVTVTQASSGEQAVSLFSAGEFDLIFMDIQMPGIDGMETTQIIRERETNHNRRTPIIALTAHTLSEYKTDLLIAGLDDCIRKPVSESQLAQMLNRWTGLTFSQHRPTPAPTTETKSSDEPSSPVNIAQCLALANHKKDLARDMLAMLIDSLEAEQLAFNSAYKAQDLAALQDQAHKLYGSSCYTGVPHLRSITGLLDKLLNTGQTHDLEPTMICLNNTINQLKQWAKDRDIDAAFGLTKRTTDET